MYVPRKFSKAFNPQTYTYRDYMEACYFGLTPEIFPVEVQRAYHHFSSSIYSSALSLTYRFSLYFQVPWIFCWCHQLSSRAKFKILGKILRVKWWDKYDYSCLNEEEIAKWFKTNARLSREEEDQFLLAKNSIMTSIAGAKSEADLQAVMETVVNNNSDDNKQDDPEDIINISDSSVNDIDFVNDPYYNFDISDLYLDSQSG
ncbi:Retrotransposable element Tf2 [Cucumis melo var. makuwa]|uniref:Retrotransposable element Tf2 n=1 Tax=Cucumis melo var. makuwa TaxID=1194695 RepID=A0A5A7U8X4_CUCMM|nr:Retrotransposable element Tf2 [Cucumis melo var. makuwa]TYK07814.1 Retrotransposable element Tf2 [Cucumis melo var. makuwa]